MQNVNHNEVLGEKIIEEYLSGVFGKVSKQEIDLMVFGTVARQLLLDDADLWEKDQFFWIRITPSHIRKLSLHLRIPETRVSSLVENCALFEGAEDLPLIRAIDEIERLTKKFNQDPNDLRAGKLRLFVPNKFTRRAIESFLLKSGGIPETSFHSDHLVIRLSDLLLAVGETNGIEIESLIRNISEKAYIETNNDVLRDIIKVQDKKPIKELVGNFSIALTSSIAAAGTEVGVDNLFNWFRTAIEL